MTQSRINTGLIQDIQGTMVLQGGIQVGCSIGEMQDDIWGMMVYREACTIGQMQDDIKGTMVWQGGIQGIIQDIMDTKVMDQIMDTKIQRLTK